MTEKNSTESGATHDDKTRKRTERVLKAFSIVITLFLLIVLVVIKINVTTFPIGWFIGIFIFLIALGLTVFFISDIVKKFKDKTVEEETDSEKVPRPLTLDELRRICREALTNEDYCNHTKGCLGEKFVTLKKSKNTIYIYKTESLYKGIGDNGIVYILINANFPEMRSILFNPSDYELKKTIDSMGTSPEDEPEERVTRRSNPLLGTEEEIIERKPPVEEEPKKETNEGEIE